MLVSRNPTLDKSKEGIDNYMKMDDVQTTKKLFGSIQIKDALGEDEHKDSNTTLGSWTNAAPGSMAFY